MQNTTPGQRHIHDTALTLPAKWVIKRTPQNAEMVNKWANEKDRSTTGDLYYDKDGFIYSESVGSWPDKFYDNILYPDFVEITDSQFKAMVEGETKPDQNVFFNEAERIEIIKSINDDLIKAEYPEEAERWRAKHPEIWPVDYAAIVLEKAVVWYKHVVKDGLLDEPVNPFMTREYDVLTAVRNYLTNQK